MTVLEKAIEASKDMLASCVGSAACVYSGQPFDTVKVRMQVNPGGMYTGSIHCIRTTIKYEGVMALWTGSLPAFLGAVMENAVAFCVNGTIKRLIEGITSNDRVSNSKKDLDFTQPFLNGALTGAVTSVFLCPFDVVKCRSQVWLAHNGSNNSIKQPKNIMMTVVKQIMKTEGVRGMFRGFATQITRDIPFYASFFGSYEVLCMLLQKYTELPDTAVYFVSGGLAGQIGWVVSIAPDSVKSQIQGPEVVPTTSMRTVAKQIYRTNGIAAFFVGLEVAIIRAFPANAALFVGYELSRKMLG